jgi:hypothetical protein
VSRFVAVFKLFCWRQITTLNDSVEGYCGSSVLWELLGKEDVRGTKQTTNETKKKTDKPSWHRV